MVVATDKETDLTKLDAAVARCKERVDRSPAWRLDRCDRLADLGFALWKRFESTGAIGDIEMAVTNQRQAVKLCPLWNPRHTFFVRSLGHMLFGRFERLGRIEDLNESIECFRKGLGLVHPRHANRSATFNNLASSVYARFRQWRDAEDIDEAIQLHRKALALRPAPHPDRADSLRSLANSVHERFMQRGDAEDIDEAIQLHRKALALRPAPHPDRADSLNNLAISVYVRFRQRGDAEDIDEAIQLHREALALRPAPHPDRADSLGNLASSVLQRFVQRGDAEDIGEAIQLHREALALRPAPHPDRGPLPWQPCKQRGDAEDIDEAIQLLREALALHPAPHPDRAGSLNNLASSVYERFSQRGDAEDIDEAIQLNREALALRPAPHPDRAGHLGNLASSVMEGGNADDIDEAIQLHREALALHPAPHPDRARSLRSLAICLELSGSLSTAIPLFREASAYTSASLLSRFKVAKQWAITAHENHHATALEAYQTALALLPRLAAFSLDVQSRHSILVEAQSHNIALDAATCAIDLGQYEIAIELLEAGRSVFWSQSLHLRTSFDDLRMSHPLLATKLAELSWKLEQSSFRDASRNLASDSQHRVMSLEAEGLNCRRLNDEWVRTVESVRSISKLRLVANCGPVVVLNAGESSCHALILNSPDNIHCVPLPDMTRNSVYSLTEIIQALISATPSLKIHSLLANRACPAFESINRLIGRLDEEESPDEWFRSVLFDLWNDIVKPVFQFLQIQKSEKPPRLWWCPTGPFAFLPIHAAGIYDPQSRMPIDTVADYVISSYTPTLTVLLSPPFPLLTTTIRTTVVIQPATPGFSPLPFTDDELRRIKEKIPAEWLTSLGTVESPASVETVLRHLLTSSIIHFAGHGIQDIQKPLQSALIIGGDKLTVSQIMKMSGVSYDGPTSRNSTKHMALAFLSACQTATGFRSVVGTMWTMNDSDGPVVADIFYGHLFRNADPSSNPPVFPDLNESAEALHLAVKKLLEHTGDRRGVKFASIEIKPAPQEPSKTDTIQPDNLPLHVLDAIYGSQISVNRLRRVSTSLGVTYESADSHGQLLRLASILRREARQLSREQIAADKHKGVMNSLSSNFWDFKQFSPACKLTNPQYLEPQIPRHERADVLREYLVCRRCSVPHVRARAGQMQRRGRRDARPGWKWFIPLRTHQQLSCNRRTREGNFPQKSPVLPKVRIDEAKLRVGDVAEGACDAIGEERD
ncbi:aromatic di-alanine and tetratricopeptide repeat-containing protein [Mycena pura]|uniref:Aromatic di-alanine and tetratricopeptide repeat-containing protein n=1 Tax=Mycena pura TaxID=153505 RepID=A0AAD6UTW5_9AGAR|nr:aromatic di-alanine and tetratricopeptide repeat-containing protein [Mycena pura]